MPAILLPSDYIRWLGDQQSRRVHRNWNNSLVMASDCPAWSSAGIER